MIANALRQSLHPLFHVFLSQFPYFTLRFDKDIAGIFHDFTGCPCTPLCQPWILLESDLSLRQHSVSPLLSNSTQSSAVLFPVTFFLLVEYPQMS